jgi:hypothetical protein
MKHLIKKWIAEAIREERKLFAVYEDTPEGREPLMGLDHIQSEYVPRNGENIQVLRGNVLYKYKVIEVNHIYHFSSSEFQEGHILVTFVSAVQI